MSLSMDRKVREKTFSENEIIITGHGGNFNEKSLTYTKARYV